MNVSRETNRRLDEFRAEFARWAPRINLTARGERGGLDERHIADSLQLMTIRPPEGAWFDMGTGGGFPGAILAAAEADHEARVTMVESNGKKAAFLRSACLAMKTERSAVLAERAEAVVARLPPPGTVSARALASLSDLLAMLEPWLAKGTVGIFPKGRTAKAEIQEARSRWAFECVAHPSSTADDASVLEIRGLTRH